MVKNIFSKSWKKSTQPRKQRKYSYNAPLHIKKRKLHVHLSPELRKKYGLRNFLVRKGDKVRVLRGQYCKKEGKVERVSVKQTKVYITGIELVKKEGTKSTLPLNPSNLMIIDLNVDDHKRKAKLASKSESTKKATVKSKVETKKSESSLKVEAEKSAVEDTKTGSEIKKEKKAEEKEK